MCEKNEPTEGEDEVPRPPQNARVILRDRMNLADSPLAAFTRMVRGLAKDAQRRKE